MPDAIADEMLRIAKDLRDQKRLILFALAILQWYEVEGPGSEDDIIAFLEREAVETNNA